MFNNSRKIRVLKYFKLMNFKKTKVTSFDGTVTLRSKKKFDLSQSFGNCVSIEKQKRHMALKEDCG